MALVDVLPGRTSTLARKLHPRSAAANLPISWAAAANGVLVAGLILTLAAALRGLPGNPTPEDLQQSAWQQNGPLELSPERGRFALTVAIVQDHSFTLSLPLARFSTPDVGYIHGHYVSLFAPGVSFITLPGYLLGHEFGLAQVGTYALIAIFALFNALLVRLIALEVGANRPASWLGALAFLFASPAFVYAVSLFEHQVSLFLLLLPLYLLFRTERPWVLPIVWLAYGLSIAVDYPNAVLLAPMVILAMGRIVPIQRVGEQIGVRLKIASAATALLILLPAAGLMWFNAVAYGSPLQISGTVPAVQAIDGQGHPVMPDTAGNANDGKFVPDPSQQDKSVGNFFRTRNLINGLYILLLSPDRGWLFYTPVTLLGIGGAWLLRKRKSPFLNPLLAVVVADVMLYALWGDPWGGWAFGARYLVPSYAVLAILLAVALSHWRRHWLFLAGFGATFGYSLAVNVLGALTSSADPPKVEVAALEQVTGHTERYTWLRNWDFLHSSGTKSALYQVALSHKLSPVDYYFVIVSGLAAVALLLLVSLYFRRARVQA